MYSSNNWHHWLTSVPCNAEVVHYKRWVKAQLSPLYPHFLLNFSSRDSFSFRFLLDLPPLMDHKWFITFSTFPRLFIEFILSPFYWFGTYANFPGHAFILVYSVTSRQSLEELKPIWDMILSIKGDLKDVPIILVGNKCDENENRELTQVCLSILKAEKATNFLSLSLVFSKFLTLKEKNKQFYLFL